MTKMRVYAMGMLVFGTVTGITMKLQFEMMAPGLDSESLVKFNKPYFNTWSMFVGMSLCLPLSFVVAGGGKAAAAAPMTEASRRETSYKSWRAFRLCFFPASFDLVATTLNSVGLLWTPVSVFQMLRGAMMVFAAVLSVVFLKRKLQAYHWIGLATCVSALVMVGAASIKSASAKSASDGAYQALGIMVILLAQLVSASQMVTEEAILKTLEAEPIRIIGLEGVWGCFIMCVVLIAVSLTPADQSQLAHLYHEDTKETIAMLMHSAPLVGVVSLFIGAIIVYNLSALSVTKTASAVHRTLLNACRSVSIWFVSLLMHHVFHFHGEAWTPWSWLQLAGFVFLVLGTLIYNKIVLVPGLDYGQDYAEIKDNHNKTSKEHLQSPTAIYASVNNPVASPVTVKVITAGETVHDGNL